MRRVSVESGLKQIRQRLEERGYEVVPMENCFSSVEAVVYSGAVGGTSVCAHGPEGTMLVNAQGLTPDAVADRLDDI
jgi:hypothetical protein